MAKTTQKLNWTTIVLVIYFFAGVLGTYAFVKHFLDKGAKPTHKKVKDNYRDKMRQARRSGPVDVAAGSQRHHRSALNVQGGSDDMGQLKKMAQMKSTKPCSEEECCGEGTTYVNGKCEKVTDIKETWAYAKKKKKGKSVHAIKKKMDAWAKYYKKEKNAK